MIWVPSTSKVHAEGERLQPLQIFQVGSRNQAIGRNNVYAMLGGKSSKIERVGWPKAQVLSDLQTWALADHRVTRATLSTGWTRIRGVTG